jgi:methylated-DNA-[protein]-cysteine S-methyltransferase
MRKSLITIRTPVGRFGIIVVGGEVSAFGWEVPALPEEEPERLSGNARRFCEELEEYFRSGRWNFSWFELPRPCRPLSEKALLVYDYLRRRVGPGSVITYRELGLSTGVHPHGIGSMMRSNPWPVVVPCHRVVGSDGSLVGYAGGLDRKRWLLRLEGWLPHCPEE